VKERVIRQQADHVLLLQSLRRLDRVQAYDAVLFVVDEHQVIRRFAYKVQQFVEMLQFVLARILRKKRQNIRSTQKLFFEVKRAGAVDYS